jgi:hypothetical protein
MSKKCDHADHEELDEIRDVLDVPAEDSVSEAVENLVEKYQNLAESVEDLLFRRLFRRSDNSLETLDAVNELLDDVAEMVKILDPILGGYSSTDDTDTISMRALPETSRTIAFFSARCQTPGVRASLGHDQPKHRPLRFPSSP